MLANPLKLTCMKTQNRISKTIFKNNPLYTRQPLPIVAKHTHLKLPLTLRKIEKSYPENLCSSFP